MLVPVKPKIYHIVNVDRLPSIVADGRLWCDATMRLRRDDTGTTIGMNSIKQRRLDNTLTSHPALCVGECVPFYFCPRSVMLYKIFRRNDPNLTYRGGQGPILHLEAELHETVAWANRHARHWAISKSNAGAIYFEDFSDLDQLNKLDWAAIHATDWRGGLQDGKQAEFLVEDSFSWRLVRRIGVLSQATRDEASRALGAAAHRPPVEIKPDWYY